MDKQQHAGSSKLSTTTMLLQPVLMLFLTPSGSVTSDSLIELALVHHTLHVDACMHACTPHTHHDACIYLVGDKDRLL